MRPCIEKNYKFLQTGTFSTHQPMRKKGRPLNKGKPTAFVGVGMVLGLRLQTMGV